MAPRGKAATLSIVIAGDNKGAKKALNETGKDVAGLGNRVKGMAVGLGAAFAVTKVVQWGKAASDAYRTVGGEIIKLQRYTGLAAEEASGLRMAAALSGVDIGKLSVSLGQLNKKIESGSIDDLGFQFRDAGAQILPMDEILAQIMDRFEGMENGPEKSALALKLFGRAGAELIPLLSRGSAGLEEMKQKAEELGLSFDEAGLEQVKEATKNQREFNQAMLGMKVAVGAELQPLINDVTTLGKTALPPVIGGLRTTIGLFTMLPPQVQATAVGLGAASLILPRLASGLGSVAVGVGNLTSLYPRMSSALRNNVSNLSASTTAMAGAAAAVISYTAATAGLNAIVSSKTVSVDAQALTVALQGLARTGEMSGELGKYGENLDGLAAAFRNLNRDKGDVAEDLGKFAVPGVGAALGTDALTDAKAAKETFEEIDLVLKGMAESDPEEARKAFGGIASALNDQGMSFEEIGQMFPRYWEGLETGKTAAEGETEAIKEQTNALDAGRAARERAAAAVQRRNTRVEAERSAEEAVTSAHEDHATALDELADAEREAGANSEALRDARQAEQDAMEGVTDALRGVRDAEEAVAEAQEGVADAQRNLNDARVEAAEKIADLAEASRDAQLAIRGADIDVREAYEKWQDILRSPASQIEKDQAEQDYLEAKEAAQDARDEAAQAQQDAAQAEAAGVEGSPEVLAAKEALADANDGVTDALERVQDANKGVEDANRRVQDAERNTAQVAEEVAKRHQEAKKAAEQATKNVIEKESELAAAGLNGEAAIRAQQTALRDLANDYAPGSVYRTYIEDLIRDLAIAAGGTVGIGGDYASPDAADRGGPTGGPKAPSPQDESRDPVRRSGPLVVQHIHGTAVQERRQAKRLGDDLADRLARTLG